VWVMATFFRFSKVLEERFDADVKTKDIYSFLTFKGGRSRSFRQFKH